MTCTHSTILVTQHFDGGLQPVYTRVCKACDVTLLDQRQPKADKKGKK